jgi:hypothetical protein
MQGAGTRSVESPWLAIRVGFGFPRKKYILAPTGRYCIAEGNALAYVGRGNSPRPSVIPCRVLAPGAWNLRGWLSVLALGFRVRKI